ncbi:hypothetical protein FNW52_10250 [Flavobacterium sp. ZT3R18]|uniref:hypothetical protein n=1 Tax=Flavobacterium sp. ZT3R18 TaxID=2594429 RepID=UPI00117B80EC|nr:hypothetical protein [Flavobacterium sp. ZT3R18]TRX35860.1 hypothetical protein FNW52_10250 [Flavobacterium sp. ZT3R18]
MDDNTRRIYEKYGINPKEREKENQEILNKRMKELSDLNRDRLVKEFNEGLDKNYDDLKEYLFFYNVTIFKELESNIFQNIQCLIVNAYSASITLTNLILERLLKLTLIQNEIGLDPVRIEDWNETYKETHRYSKMILNETIKLCHERNLINDEQEEYLTDMRNQFRNGFSHYDPTKILIDHKETAEVHFSNENPEKAYDIEVNMKQIPVLQYYYVKQFARENALQYFDYVFHLIRSIEKKLKYKHNYEGSKKTNGNN